MKFHYCVGFLLASSLFCVTHAASKLESYNVDPSSVTVSGLSSGGAMAMQFHIAFSDIVHGAGIFAGLPFSCAKGGLVYANLCMTNPGSQVVATLVGNIDGLASSGKIDPTSNLSGDKVFIFHGTKDTTVYPAAGTKIQAVYEHYNVVTETKLDMGAVHGFPTDFYGAACGLSSATTQYINNCDYHGAYEMLNYLYGGSLTKPTKSVPLNGLLTEYDQAEFGATNAISMDPIGYVYVPTGCADRTNQCKFHISLHGCQQSRATINDIYAKNTGYLEVAELNDIIVIFPQTKANMLIGNPNACWDWWGYLNVNFLNQDGAQMQALYKMLNRVVFCDGNEECFDEETPAPATDVTAIEGTTEPSTGPCEPNTVTFHPFPGMCEYYTMCACGVEVLLQCAPGLWFDPSINNCNFIQLVDCEPASETSGVSHNFFNKFYYNLN